MNPFVTCVSLGLVALLALPACQSNADKGDATGASITTSAGLIERGLHELDATLASLHKLTDAPSGDLVAKRKEFEKNLATLESTADEVVKTATQMDERGRAYFAEWDQQLASIHDEEIRARSTDRLTAVEASFSDLQSQYGGAKNAFQPLMSNLRDIRTAVGSDLTVDGLKSLQPSVAKVDSLASAARQELNGLVESFRELGVGLSRTAPVPPK